MFLVISLVEAYSYSLKNKTAILGSDQLQSFDMNIVFLEHFTNYK